MDRERYHNNKDYRDGFKDGEQSGKAQVTTEAKVLLQKIFFMMNEFDDLLNERKKTF